MNQLTNLPPIQWAMRHPRLAAWMVLWLGMAILLIIEARDVGLLATQWVALIVACGLVAGACIWIISWEDDDEAEAEPSKEQIPAAPPVAEAEQTPESQ